MKKILFFIVFFSGILFADPLLIKSADTSFIPVLAKSWQEKNDGVMMKIKRGVKLKVLKKNLQKIFPEMDVEIFGDNIFFPSTNIRSLFNLIAGVDMNISLNDDPMLILKEKSNRRFLKRNSRELSLKNRSDSIVATVLAVSFDGKNGMMKLNIKITKKAKSGLFKRLFRRQVLKVFFNMKDNKVDVNDLDNRKKLKVLLLKKDSEIVFTISRKAPDGSFVVSQIEVKKI